MSEYILSEGEANRMLFNCECAKEIDALLAENNLFEQHKEQNSKVTIIFKKQHIPLIDELMLHCISELHGPENDEECDDD